MALRLLELAFELGMQQIAVGQICQLVIGCNLMQLFLYLFAFRDVPLLQENDYDVIAELKNRQPCDQDVPFMGPPVLRDTGSGRSLSQMPAIVRPIGQ